MARQLLIPRSAVTDVAVGRGYMSHVSIWYGSLRWGQGTGLQLGRSFGGRGRRRQWQLSWRPLAAVESVGAMDTLFEMARQYALDRFASADPWGFRRSNISWLTTVFPWRRQGQSQRVPSRRSAAAGRRQMTIVSIAKAWVGDVGIDVAQGCMQIFGGIEPDLGARDGTSVLASHHIQRAPTATPNGRVSGSVRFTGSKERAVTNTTGVATAAREIPSLPQYRAQVRRAWLSANLDRQTADSKDGPDR